MPEEAAAKTGLARRPTVTRGCTRSHNCYTRLHPCDIRLQAGCAPLGAFKGFAVAGCSPEEMGIGPTVAVPRLLERHGLTVSS